MAVRAQGRTERRRVLARELAAALAPFGVEVDRLARPPAGLARATFLVGPGGGQARPARGGRRDAERLRVLRAVEPPDPLVPRPLTDEPFALSVGLG